MLLVDTSVWIDHIDGKPTRLRDALEQHIVRMHPFVVGEIALGTLKDRTILTSLDRLPRAAVASPSETRYAIERHELAGSGIGYVDTHLLISVLVTPGCFLLTHDKRLAAVSARLNILA